jgi:hypothetical protein
MPGVGLGNPGPEIAVLLKTSGFLLRLRRVHSGTCDSDVRSLFSLKGAEQGPAGAS